MLSLTKRCKSFVVASAVKLDVRKTTTVCDSRWQAPLVKPVQSETKSYLCSNLCGFDYIPFKKARDLPVFPMSSRNDFRATPKAFMHEKASSMKELFYFSFADLMVRVEYQKEANSLRYATHRKITFGERIITEQYLLTTIALKTEYYQRQPALFIYLGIDAQLVKDLSRFHLKNNLKSLARKEKDVVASVNGLINQSMQNYYFEQIGDTILNIRREMEHDGLNLLNEQLGLFKLKMEELIKAYNLYSEQKITIQQVIPSDLKTHFGIMAQPE